MSDLDTLLSSIEATCPADPRPDVAMVQSAGRSRAAVATSANVAGAILVDITTSIGDSPTRAIGVKSLTAS
jgi:hypothetical protein